MKTDALRILGKGRIEINTIDVPEPEIGKVQVEITACGICAWDSLLYNGGSLFEDYPLYFGHEGVGVITKVGPGVKDYQKNDLVFCAGGGIHMAQRVNLDSRYITKIPENSNPVLWVGEPVACAVNGIDQLEITPGESVALIGAGFMGLLQIQGLSHTLSGNITVFDLDKNKLQLAKEFGADEIYISGSPEADKKIEQIKNIGGSDIVIEASGSSGGLDLAQSLMSRGGKLSLFGWQKGAKNFDGTSWHLGGYKIINTAPGSDRHFHERLPQTAKLISKGVFNLEKLVTHVSDYKNAQKIFEIAAARKDNYIKGVITF